MGGPVGNQFWKLRSKHGRDCIYEDAEVFGDKVLEYFEDIHANPLIEEKPMVADGVVQMVQIKKLRPFTIHGLCVHLGISLDTLTKYEKKDGFCDIITHARVIIYQQKFEGAAAGFFNSNIIARDLGLSDKKVLDHQSKGEPITGMRITKGGD